MTSAFQRYRDPGPTELAHSNETLDALLAHRSVRSFTDEPIDTELLAKNNLTQGRSVPWTWAMPARLRDVESLRGRETIRQSLESLGWKSR